jgi:hypothetical protein
MPLKPLPTPTNHHPPPPTVNNDADQPSDGSTIVSCSVSGCVHTADTANANGIFRHATIATNCQINQLCQASTPSFAVPCLVGQHQCRGAVVRRAVESQCHSVASRHASLAVAVGGLSGQQHRASRSGLSCANVITRTAQAAQYLSGCQLASMWVRWLGESRAMMKVDSMA